MFDQVIQSPYVDWITVTAQKARPYAEAETLGWNCQAEENQMHMLKRIKLLFQPTSKCNTRRKEPTFCVTPLNSSDIFIKVGSIFSDSQKKTRVLFKTDSWGPMGLHQKRTSVVYNFLNNIFYN